jgi:hypothetical protein
MEARATKFLCKFGLRQLMKRFLVILLCLSSCLFFRPETVNAARHVASSGNGNNIPHSAGMPGAEALKAEKTSGSGLKQESNVKIHQAARAKEPSSPQGFMDAELLALLLLIMVLGMLYTNPSR